MSSILRRAAVLFLLLGVAGLNAGDPVPPPAPELLWADLGTDDPVKAHRAMLDLAAQAEQTVSFLARQVRPVPTPDPRRLSRLLADLDHPRFPVRERATQDLERLGEPAEAALREALAGRPSPEVRRRIEKVLESNKNLRLHPSREQRRLERAVEVLEMIGRAPARQLLKTLAEGTPDAPLTRDAQGALERLTGPGSQRRSN
jgi:hypothetical protein